jgi:hypothetical protein
MGLAERFKNRLEQRDIFSANKHQTSPISAVENRNIVKPVTNILNSTPEPKTERYEFEDIEAQVIDKIKKTPYWNEYSIQKQENMINLYIDKKAVNGNPISANQKKELVNNIMILTNRS